MESIFPTLYPPSGDVTPLRVGLLLESPRGPEWLQQLITDIDSADFATLAAVLVRQDAGAAFGERDSASNGRAFSAGRALFWLYTALDARLHPSTGGPARPLELDGTDVIADACDPAPSPRFVTEVEKRELDVILAPGAHGEDLQAFAKLASKGVLFAFFGKFDEDREGPALLWRIYDTAAKAGTHVRIVRETGAGASLALESYASTTDSVWLSRQVQAASWRASALLLRLLRVLAVGEDPALEEAGNLRANSRGAPSNQQMTSFFVRCGGRLLRRKLRKLAREVQWLIAYRRDPERFFSSSEKIDLGGFLPILPAKDHAYADPCVIHRDGTNYVFFEDLKRRSGRGTIAFLTIDAKGDVGPVHQVLSRGHHLSYPFVFEWEGSIYMLPDMAEADCVQVFRARSFPFDWVLERELLRGRPMVDPTMHVHDGWWFLFLNVKETRRGSLNDELFLFFAETPLGPWKPHPKNPICSDVRRARPAGRLFRRRGTLIRPSQDCSVRYGSRINLCEVKALSPRHYEEEIVARVDPGPDTSFDGCHTLSFSEQVEVIDVRRTISRFGNAAMRIDGGIRPPEPSRG